MVLVEGSASSMLRARLTLPIYHFSEFSPSAPAPRVGPRVAYRGGIGLTGDSGGTAVTVGIGSRCGNGTPLPLPLVAHPAPYHEHHEQGSSSTSAVTTSSI
jgi:hypothetical protein